MKLRDYLSTAGETPKTFAERLGVTDMAVRHWLSGSRTPSMDIMRRIVDATGGAVTPNDFFDLDPAVSADGEAA